MQNDTSLVKGIRYRYFLKRAIDILGVIFLLIIFFPIYLITAIAIKVDSTGPIFADVPERIGEFGKKFKMYKFRSMIVNAHHLLRTEPKFFKLYNEYKKGSYKLRKDPRITKVGKYIRKFSLDEFPQFFNILKGEMSLVGPRAYYPFELEEQQKRYPKSREFVKIILSSKPGLTGVWQVSGRSAINFDKRVEMDSQYVQRRSILYDIYLVLRTVPAVLFGRGAV